MARIYFFGKLPEDIRNQQLAEYELYHQQVLRKLKAMEQSLSNTTDNDDYYELSTLYLGLQHLQDSIRWFRHIIEQKPLSEFIR